MLDRAVQLRLNAVILQVRPAADALYASPLRAMVGIPDREDGKSAESVVRSAGVRGHRSAPARPRAARVVQSVSRAPSVGEVARRRANHISVTQSRAGEALRQHAVDGSRRAGGARAHARGDARRRASGTTSMAFTSTTTSIRTRRRTGAARYRLPRRPQLAALPAGLAERCRETTGAERTSTVSSTRFTSAIKAIKPWVKFGISPFGVWRPGYPPITRGQIRFIRRALRRLEKVDAEWMGGLLHAAALLADRPSGPAAIPCCLQWWVEQNAKGRHIWPGNYVDKVTGTPTGWPAEEISIRSR